MNTSEKYIDRLMPLLDVCSFSNTIFSSVLVTCSDLSSENVFTITVSTTNTDKC